MLRATPCFLKKPFYTVLNNNFLHSCDNALFSIQQKAKKIYSDTVTWYKQIAGRTGYEFIYGRRPAIEAPSAQTHPFRMDPVFQEAKRHAEIDTSFSRVDPLLQSIPDEDDRLTLAMIEIKKINGITDRLAFTRTRLSKYALGENSKKILLEQLDLQLQKGEKKGVRCNKK